MKQIVSMKSGNMEKIFEKNTMKDDENETSV